MTTPQLKTPVARLGLAALFVSPSSLLVSCLGTDTGNPVGDEPTQTDIVQIGECKDPTIKIEPVAWAHSVLSGFSAEDVFSTLPHETSARLEWNSDLTSLREPTDLSVTLKPLGRAALIRVEKPPADGEQTDGPPVLINTEEKCSTHLRIDVQLELGTADGALSETFTTQLDVEHPELGRTHFRVPLADLSDGLRSLLADGSHDALDVRLSYSKVGILGELVVVDTSGDPTNDDADLPSAQLATFPAGRPCGDAFPVSGSETLFGLSPDVLERELDRVRTLSWQLEHEEGTVQVSCEVEVPRTLCVGSGGPYEFLTTVTLSTEDGSLDGSFQANLSANLASDEEVGRLGLSAGKYIQGVENAKGLGREYGLVAPPSLEGYVDAGADFVLDVSDEPWGVYRFSGFSPCTMPGPACDGLSGGMVGTTLYGLRLGEPQGGYELEGREE